MMQVSRTALREAVKTLEAENIVEVKNGKGIYVGNGGQQSYSIQSILGFTQEKERLLEALEARRAMEKRAACYGGSFSNRSGDGRTWTDYGETYGEGSCKPSRYGRRQRVS